MRKMNLKKRIKCYLCKSNAYQMMYYLKDERICRECTTKIFEETKDES